MWSKGIYDYKEPSEYLTVLWQRNIKLNLVYFQR